MSKKLIAYFSASGTTERVAQDLGRVADADLYEIEPEVPYTSVDLDWRNQNSRSSVEMKDHSSRPAVVLKDPQLDNYDVVFVGFPIWWYIAPTIINSFLEGHDFSGKTIVLFATSGGSGFGKTVENLRPSVAADTTILEGQVFRGRASEAELKALAELA